MARDVNIQTIAEGRNRLRAGDPVIGGLAVAAVLTAFQETHLCLAKEAPILVLSGNRGILAPPDFPSWCYEHSVAPNGRWDKEQKDR